VGEEGPVAKRREGQASGCAMRVAESRANPALTHCLPLPRRRLALAAFLLGRDRRDELDVAIDRDLEGHFRAVTLGA
jgi:hypothetical protein